MHQFLGRDRARDRSRGHGGSPFSPSQRTAGHVFWWRPGLDTTTKDGSNRMSAVTDLSPAAHHTTQGTGAAQPLFVASDAGYNGIATATFDSARFMDTALFTALPQPLTYYVLGHLGAAGTQAFIDAIAGQAATEIACYASTGNVQVFPGTTVLTSSTLVTAKSVMCFVVNGASSSIYVNDHTTAVATGGSGTHAPVSFRVGMLTATSGMTGTVAEILVYTGTDTIAQRDQVMRYLGARGGKAVT